MTGFTFVRGPPERADAETVPYVDVTAAEMLARLREDLTSEGIRLEVMRDIGQVRDVLRVTQDR